MSNPIKKGFKNINMDNIQYEVIEVLGNDRFKVRFEDGYETIKRSKEIRNGCIRNIYTPYVYGIGYIGEDNYKADKKIYNIWHGMMKRCYDNKSYDKHATYKDCEVCEEWHNFTNFRIWYEENYYEIEGEGMALDKDILHKGNKIYSPDTCVFVPERINNLFTKNNKNRGNYPIGVSWKEKNQKFQVQCSIIENGKKKYKYLGLCNSPYEGFIVYKTFKEKYIKEVADEYKDKIPNKLYEALYKYEIEIND